jgi:hypothetical protein
LQKIVIIQNILFSFLIINYANNQNGIEFDKKNSKDNNSKAEDHLSKINQLFEYFKNML